MMDIANVTGEAQDTQYSWQSALLSTCPRGWHYLEKVNYSRMFQDYLLPAIDVAGHRVSRDACRRSDKQLAAMLNNPAPVVVLRHQLFIRQLPHDVINGQPLKYRRADDDQYLLYSVGWNQTDDGGVLGLTKSGGGIDQKVGDWVWRLTAG